MSHNVTRGEAVKPGYRAAALKARRNTQMVWKAQNREKSAENDRRYRERKES